MSWDGEIATYGMTAERSQCEAAIRRSSILPLPESRETFTASNASAGSGWSSQDELCMPHFMEGSCSVIVRSAINRRDDMPIARLASAWDLPSLLALFDVSEVSAVAQPRERAERIWEETLAHPGVRVFVSDDRGRIAASCMLVIAPNLLRSGRRHEFLENVVTHPELRGRGHGKAVVLAAQDMQGRLTATTC
jgi:GNAT superfamily N-acetyltransferase